MRWVSVGSEDNSVYTYDVRAGAGTYLERLTAHTDVVAALESVLSVCL